MSETALVVDLQTGSIQALPESSLRAAGLLERRDLQRWIREHPELVEPDLLLVTSEFDRFEFRDSASRIDSTCSSSTHPAVCLSRS
jgi:hypothetical protein